LLLVDNLFDSNHSFRNSASDFFVFKLTNLQYKSIIRGTKINMTEIFQSISNHNKAQFDQGYKKGLAEGAKNNGSGFVSLVIMLAIGYGLYTYTQKNIAQPAQVQTQVLGIKSSSEPEVKQIPANEVNIVIDQSADVKIKSNEIESGISLDISPSSTIRRGIFQPKK
jgi:hypothetical protein